MIKYLFHLLSRYHFLHKAVDGSHIFLLLPEISAAFPAVVLNKQKHQRKEKRHNQRKTPVQKEKHDQCAGQHREALNQQRKAVVQRIGKRVDVVCKITHQLAMRAAVKKLQRQRLYVAEQIRTDFKNDLLRGLCHKPVIAPGRRHAGKIHNSHCKQRPD